MPASRSSSKGRLINVVLIVVIIAAALAARPLKVLYHDSAMRAAWIESVQGPGSTNVASVAKFERHCNALVSLGYLARREFRLANIKSHSKEHETLFNALNARAAKGAGYFLIQGFEEKAVPMVTIFALPAEMAGWESIITSLDRAK